MAEKKLTTLDVLKNRISTIIYKTKNNFPGSQKYWEQRYAKGGNSGSGSYNQLADFKADVLNKFVKDNNITTVIEFGCGDGNQLSLASYPKYKGLDVSPTAIRICMDKFNSDNSKSFYLYDSKAFRDNENVFKSDLSLSLDVIFHLVEDEIFGNYMEHLFNAASKHVIIYASNVDNKRSLHHRDRMFTNWVENNRTDWKMSQKIENKHKFAENNPDNTSIADFYIFEKK